MTIVANGTGVNDSTADGVAEEEEVRDMFFFRSAFGLSRKLFGRSKPLIHYPILIPPKKRKKTSIVSSINYSYHYMHMIIAYTMLNVSF
jgi:hypothetical protein